VAGKRSGRGEPAGGWQQGMRAGRRPQDVVGLDAVDLLAEQAMRSGRRMGLVIGCLADGEHGRLRTRTRRRPCRAARTHSPHSRPFSPSSGGPAAIRRPPARPRRPPGRPGPAAASQTHYRLTTWGLLLADVRHPQAMRGPRSFLASYLTVENRPHHASDEEPPKPT
jgi:hypothetical protein